MTLVGLGLTAIGTGLHVLIAQESISPDASVFYSSWPYQLRAFLWTMTGLLAVLGGLKGRLEVVGWGAIGVMPTERLVAHFVSLMAYLVPGPPAGELLAVAEVIRWLGWVLVILTLATHGKLLILLSQVGKTGKDEANGDG